MSKDVRASNWALTINNPTEKDEEEISLARQKGWSVEGQKEVGADGTPHYQLHVKTPQVRWSALKKAFSRAHIEVARNVPALVNYVHKEETRVGQLSVSQDQYPSLSKLWKLMYSWLTESRGYEFELVDISKSESRVPCRVRFIKGEHKSIAHIPLEIFDEFIKDMIVAGYYVESIGINPQTRSSWNNYWSALIARELIAKQDADKKTDRQTDKEDDVASEENVDE